MLIVILITIFRIIRQFLQTNWMVCEEVFRTFMKTGFWEHFWNMNYRDVYLMTSLRIVVNRFKDTSVSHILYGAFCLLYTGIKIRWHLILLSKNTLIYAWFSIDWIFLFLFTTFYLEFYLYVSIWIFIRLFLVDRNRHWTHWSEAKPFWCLNFSKNLFKLLC